MGGWHRDLGAPLCGWKIFAMALAGGCGKTPEPFDMIPEASGIIRLVNVPPCGTTRFSDLANPGIGRTVTKASDTSR